MVIFFILLHHILFHISVFKYNYFEVYLFTKSDIKNFFSDYKQLKMCKW